MNWIVTAFRSSIGKKVLVGLSGLGLVGFLVAHLYGNLHVYGEAEDHHGHMVNGIDVYAHHLHEQPWIGPAEIGLVLMFVLHIGLVLQLVMENRAARGSVRYKKTGTKVEKSRFQNLTSKLMVVSGVVVLAFLVVHIVDFRLQRSEIEGEVAETMFDLLSGWRGALYIAGSLFIGWHMYHGIRSGFRSLGINHEKYTPLINAAGIVLSIALAIGFASIPVAILAGLIG